MILKLVLRFKVYFVWSYNGMRIFLTLSKIINTTLRRNWSMCFALLTSKNTKAYYGKQYSALGYVLDFEQLLK